jgi:hypothetical protein
MNIPLVFLPRAAAAAVVFLPLFCRCCHRLPPSPPLLALAEPSATATRGPRRSCAALPPRPPEIPPVGRSPPKPSLYPLCPPPFPASASSPPPNPKIQSLLRRLYRGQQRGRRLRGATSSLHRLHLRHP